MSEIAISFKDLVLEFGAVRALDGVSIDVRAGKILGIVGESGSGKSTVGFAAGRLMPHGVRPASGKLEVLGKDVWSLPIEEMRAMRIADLRYIFQDPIATLDPTKKVGAQIGEAATKTPSLSAIHDVLREVGMNDPETVARAWPHELSGGMAQRVVIAMALISAPKVIIADEATSALDASVRTRILELMREASRARGITLLLLSHDLWAVRKFCDDIAVMYAGRVVEQGPAEAIFAQPAHPYTQALIAATVGHEKRGEKLATIEGIPPQLRGPSKGCAFAPRCAHANWAVCDTRRPEYEQKEDRWILLCHRWREIAGGANGPD